MIRFSIPNVPSLTSTKPNPDGSLFVPNLKVIVSFFTGDLSDAEQGVAGFSDVITKRNIANNLKLCKNVDDFEMYRNISNIELPNDSSYYFQSGKVILSTDDIKLPVSNNYSGMKAFEKTIIQSLLETQKPYMEIFKGVAESMVKIEDIVACVLAVGGRSLKPKFNPRALSYKKNQNVLFGALEGMSQLGSLSPSKNKGSISDGSNISSTTSVLTEQSIEYSTGEFDPTANYEYLYEYYNENKIVINTNFEDALTTDTKPPVIVFGIYNSKGILMTNEEIPKWLLDSKKFFGQFERLTNYNYKWVNGKRSVFAMEQPKGPGWRKETYANDTVVNGYSFGKGEPVIYQKGTDNQDLYKKYFDFELQSELEPLKLSADEIVVIQKDINEKMYSGNPSNLSLMVDLLVENNYLKGYDGVEIPLIKSAFIPKEIQFNGQTMYVDPETEYDMKVIKIDASPTVQYWDTVSKQAVESKLVTYDVSGIEMKMGSKSMTTIRFSAEVYKGDAVIQRHNNISVLFIPNPDINAAYKVLITEVNGNDHNQTVKITKNPQKGERITYSLFDDLGIGTYKATATTTKNVTNTVMVESSTGTRTSISIDLLLNNKLSTNKAYSDGVYGEDINYTIDTLTRFMEYNGDEETYYIVEGILESTNDNYADIDIEGNGGSKGRGYYKIKDVMKAFRKFMSLIIHLATKIFPPINKTISLITNPTTLPNFILEIVTAKLGDDFGTGNVKFKTFSTKFSTDISKSMAVVSNLKSTAQTTLEKKKNIQSYLKTTSIGDYFYVTDDLDVKCLLDGKSLTELFGITFGVGVTNYVPKLFFYKNLSSNTAPVTITNAFPNGTEDATSYMKDSVLIKNLPAIVSKSVTTSISVVYSTGDYIEGVDYEYTYVSESVSNIISIGDELKEQGDVTGALKVYEKGIIADPGDQTLKKRYKDTLLDSGKDYLYELGLNNPLMDMALGMITTPIKLIKGVIDYILKFFKSLTNPFSLPGKITEFVSFKWFLDFLSKDGLLKLLGINMNIGGLKTLVNTTQDIDLSSIVSIPFLSNMPTYSADAFKNVNTNALTSMFKSVFEVIENIINMLIDLLWAIMGLAPLFKKRPYLNLSGDLPPSYSGSITDYMVNMTLGNSNDFIKGDVNATQTLRSFVYDIQISDGRTLRDLNREELEKWISENENLIIELNF